MHTYFIYFIVKSLAFAAKAARKQNQYHSDKHSQQNEIKLS